MDRGLPVGCDQGGTALCQATGSEESRSRDPVRDGRQGCSEVGRGRQCHGADASACACAQGRRHAPAHVSTPDSADADPDTPALRRSGALEGGRGECGSRSSRRRCDERRHKR